MYYKNIGQSTKTFYGVEFKPGEIKKVPGHIHNRYMIGCTAPESTKSESKEAAKQSAKPSSTSSKLSKSASENTSESESTSEVSSEATKQK